MTDNHLFFSNQKDKVGATPLPPDQTSPFPVLSLSNPKAMNPALWMTVLTSACSSLLFVLILRLRQLSPSRHGISNYRLRSTSKYCSLFYCYYAFNEQN